MILVCEPFWTGTQHAPGNSATIQTIARAFPGQQVRVSAEATHLRELQADTALTAHPNASLSAIAVSPVFPSKPQIVSARRALTEFGALRAALRAAPPGEPVLLMLLSATPTAIFAASWLARSARRRIGVQIGLHGNLNEMQGWRPRNPLARMFDLRSALGARHGGKVRFLVLENAIRTALAELLPSAAAVTDVLPLPINLTELAVVRDVAFDPPLRIGLVGQATEAKGITAFLALAREFGASHADKVAFHVVGRAVPGDDMTRFAPLAEVPPTSQFPREEFLQRLARLHYVCLPLQPGYYNLSASGALIDAVTWLKPVIATPVPIMRDMFQQFGDIGYLCRDMDEMRSIVATLLNAPDAARYARQVEAIRKARDSRMPDALAADYRRIVDRGFTRLLTP
ncbi:MAG TPA: hypothetical protein VGG99_20145 [Acetobacteraceae bacterium]|jgi:hypothetical protein